jgi:hypothetical protein
MGKIDVLISKLAADLVNTLEPSNHKKFQIQFGRHAIGVRGDEYAQVWAVLTA